MKIRLTTDRVACTPDGFGRECQRSGQVLDLPEREAYLLLERGQAIQLELETAAVTTPETASRRRPKG
jgi:hypothetical protein